MEIISCSDGKDLAHLLYQAPIYDDEDMEIKKDPKPRRVSDIWVDLNGIQESEHNGDFAITLPVTIQTNSIVFLVLVIQKMLLLSNKKVEIMDFLPFLHNLIIRNERCG